MANHVFSVYAIFKDENIVFNDQMINKGYNPITDAITKNMINNPKQPSASPLVIIPFRYNYFLNFYLYYNKNIM